jgi:hypothetical protein
MDSAGNLYFSDSGNNRVRNISVEGIIATVAGSGPVFPSRGWRLGHRGAAVVAREHRPQRFGQQEGGWGAAARL